MKQEHVTRSRGLRAIAKEIARLGRLTAGRLAECFRISDEAKVLDLIARLNYLTEKHIGECTGIGDGLAELLQQLCDEDRLQKIPVPGFPPVYWLKSLGLSEVGEIEIPGVGTVDPAMMGSTRRTRFCRSSLSDPVVMEHTLAVADLSVALYRTYNCVVLSERMLRLAEKLTGQRIATSISGHCPDVAVISPNGEITVYEVECTLHPREESEITAMGWDESDHVARVIYIAYGQSLYGSVGRLLSRVEASEKIALLRSNGKRLPRRETLCPAGGRRRHRQPGACS